MYGGVFRVIGSSLEVPFYADVVNKSLRLVLWAVCFSFLGSAWGEVSRWWNPEVVIDNFLTIALHNEYSQRQSGVRKWRSNIRYVIDHRVGDRALHKQLTEMHLRQLADITGVSIEPAKSNEQVNLRIVFSTELRLASELINDFGFSPHVADFMLRHSVCLGQFTTAVDGSIKQAVVIIPVDRARAKGLLVSCIVEELTQVMGLPNDSESVYPSIFNDQSIYMLLTGLDYVLLKILYDPSLKLGMNSQQVLPVLRQIVAKFQREKLFQRAEQLVRSGDLYALMY